MRLFGIASVGILFAGLCSPLNADCTSYSFSAPSGTKLTTKTSARSAGECEAQRRKAIDEMASQASNLATEKMRAFDRQKLAESDVYRCASESDCAAKRKSWDSAKKAYSDIENRIAALSGKAPSACTCSSTASVPTAAASAPTAKRSTPRGTTTSAAPAETATTTRDATAVSQAASTSTRGIASSESQPNSKARSSPPPAAAEDNLIQDAEAALAETHVTTRAPRAPTTRGTEVAAPPSPSIQSQTRPQEPKSKTNVVEITPQRVELSPPPAPRPITTSVSAQAKTPEPPRALPPPTVTTVPPPPIQTASTAESSLPARPPRPSYPSPHAEQSSINTLHREMSLAESLLSSGVDSSRKAALEGFLSEARTLNEVGAAISTASGSEAARHRFSEIVRTSGPSIVVQRVLGESASLVMTAGVAGFALSPHGSIVYETMTDDEALEIAGDATLPPEVRQAGVRRLWLSYGRRDAPWPEARQATLFSATDQLLERVGK